MISRRELLKSGGGAALLPIASAASLAQSKPKLVLTGDMGGVASTLGFFATDYEIVGIDRKRGPQDNLSIINPDSARKIDGAAAVVHLAWNMITPLPYQQDSISATINLLQACRERSVPRFVFASSAWADPTQARPIIKLQHEQEGGNYYGAAKRFVEDTLQLIAIEMPMKCAGIRLGRVTPRDIPDPVFGSKITMSDAEIEASFRAAMTSDSFGIIGPYDAREGRL